METTDLQRHNSTTVPIIDVLEFIRAQEGDGYGYHCRAFVGWLEERGRDLDRSSIIDYFADLNASTYSRGTVRVKRQSVKKRLRQLARAGGLGSDLSANLDQFLTDLDREGSTKAPTVQPHAIGHERYMTPEEGRMVVAACASRRQSAFIRFLFATGCRVSEVIGIRRGDMKQIGDVAFYRVVGKGSKERWVRTSVDLYEFVRDTFRGEEFLFETSNGKPYHRSYISNQIASVTRRALGRTLRSHALRHSMATAYYGRTKDLSGLSKYLGHSSVAITSTFYEHSEADTAALIGGEL